MPVRLGMGTAEGFFRVPRVPSGSDLAPLTIPTSILCNNYQTIYIRE